MILIMANGEWRMANKMTNALMTLLVVRAFFILFATWERSRHPKFLTADRQALRDALFAISH